ncbi:MAG: hypothetical protein AB7U73_24620 [Pirellulales bacterium]
MQWSTCLWPGLAPLWLRGQWSALALAAGFSLLLNAALAVSLVWTELVSPPARGAIWLAVAAIWTTSLIVSARWLAQERRRERLDRGQDLLPRIQGEYLQGHWIEAEAGLLDLLADRPRDAEARLLLATLYRHTSRVEEAASQLGHLERLDTALQWQWEIARERDRLRELPSHPTTTPVDEPSGDEPVVEDTDENAAANGLPAESASRPAAALLTDAA